jgi:DNA mismatch repair protein MSH2
VIKDVIRVYQVVGAIPKLQSALFEYDGNNKDVIQSVYVTPLTGFYDKLSRLSDLVEATVDLEAADHHEYVVKPQFSPELNEIRGKMNEIQEEIERLASKVNVDVTLNSHKTDTYAYSGCQRFKCRV